MGPLTIKGRENEVDILLNFLGQKQPISSSLFVYGPAGCGKTTTLNLVTKHIEDLADKDFIFQSIDINCVEACGSAKILYDLIIFRLCQFVANDLGTQSDLDGKFSSIRCESAGAFVNELNRFLDIWTSKGTKEERARTLCIILENAARLRDMDPTVLQVMIRLSELTGSCSRSGGLSLVTVLVSQTPWEKYPSGTFDHQPFPVFFPNYSRDQLLDILLEVVPFSRSEEDTALDTRMLQMKEKSYNSLARLVLTVCLPVCRNASELIYITHRNWPLVESLLLDARLDGDDDRTLWRAVQPQLKRSLSTIYLRETSSTTAQQEQIQRSRLIGADEGVSPMFAGDEAEEERVSGKLVTAHHQYWLELPCFARFLLIAAYLASYNPKSSDKKFFVKNTGKNSSRIKNSMKHREKTINHLIGPKPFPLDRLLAIFYAIVEDRVPHSVYMAGQVTCLVQLHLLSQCSASEDPLGNPRYKCLVSLDTVKSVARTVDFDVVQYLTDFV